MTIDQNDDQNDREEDYDLCLPAGTRLLEYSIERLLGRGGFGMTYLARDTLLDEEIAIKEYFPTDSTVRTPDLSARARSSRDQSVFRSGLDAFLGEARIIARFRHPNIVQVRRFFEAHGTGYIVLQYEGRRSLEHILADAPLPEDRIMPIFFGILDGLETLHQEAVLHRDLKPKNVMIRDDDTPVLIDFGSARDFGTRNSRTITRLASAGYSPPEQYGVGENHGPWSDFYALGAILYRAVTGVVPADSLRRLRDDPVVPAVEIARGRYNKSLLKVIDHMLQIDERKRPSSVAQIRLGLLPLSNTADAPSERPEKSNPGKGATHAWIGGGEPHAPKRSRRAFLAVALLLIAGGIALVAHHTFFSKATVDEASVSQGHDNSPEPSAPPAPDVAQKPVTPPVEPAKTLPQQSTELKEADARPGKPLTPGSFFMDCATCPEMSVVPAGHFVMGSTDGAPYEKPAHDVAIPEPFAIGRREVTIAEWGACADAGACKFRPPDSGNGSDQRPVVGISWLDSLEYLSWLSSVSGAHYRLPSEAEWEYAARGGTRSRYWWGSASAEGHANCSDCQDPPAGATRPVGSYPANAFGLFDTSGNAAEWVQDCWNDNFEGAPTDGKAWVKADCEYRVLRGGSFDNDMSYLRSAARFRYEPNVRFYANGFRVLRETPQGR